MKRLFIILALLGGGMLSAQSLSKEMTIALKNNDNLALAALVDDSNKNTCFSMGQHQASLIQLAVQMNERDIVSYLLNEQKVEPDTSCGNATALILAAKSGQTEIVKLLVKAGADISASYEGQTAADVALKNGHQEVLPLLK
ncbi:ankyrin repeat domain-containing protein [Nonlabens xiamenensis]|uniref:ankyrin repeat domain-containing protein n=1 Tax=Nonlabens xiamenensis TaxID=2341043 RepID=UPI000F60DB85|nr:ankyrin repeat domain-containing protein [Nonlabens xiamenensis]